MEADNLLVSVVMPVYNAGNTVAESIKSLLAQTHENWELLVVDDCSTDNTTSIIRRFANSDARIRLICLKANSGRPAHPRNIATKNSHGDFISFLDADDLWMPQKLAKQLSFMAEMGAKISCTGYQVIDISYCDRGSFYPPACANYDDLLRHNTVGCLTLMYDVRSLGKRYFSIFGHEDYALWLKILREGNVIYGIKEYLARYRLTPGSISSSKIKIFPFFWNIYRNEEGFSRLKSAFFCLRYAWNAYGKYQRN